MVFEVRLRGHMSSGGLTHRGGRALLDHDVDVEAVPVPEVEEADGCVVPAGLTPEFLIAEGLQQLPEQGAVRHQSGRTLARSVVATPVSTKWSFGLSTSWLSLGITDRGSS